MRRNHQLRIVRNDLVTSPEDKSERERELMRQVEMDAAIIRPLIKSLACDNAARYPRQQYAALLSKALVSTNWEHTWDENQDTILPF